MVRSRVGDIMLFWRYEKGDNGINVPVVYSSDTLKGIQATETEIKNIKTLETLALPESETWGKTFKVPSCMETFSIVYDVIKPISDTMYSVMRKVIFRKVARFIWNSVGEIETHFSVVDKMLQLTGEQIQQLVNDKQIVRGLKVGYAEPVACIRDTRGWTSRGYVAMHKAQRLGIVTSDGLTQDIFYCGQDIAQFCQAKKLFIVNEARTTNAVFEKYCKANKDTKKAEKLWYSIQEKVFLKDGVLLSVGDIVNNCIGILGNLFGDSNVYEDGELFFNTKSGYFHWYNSDTKHMYSFSLGRTKPSDTILTRLDYQKRLSYNGRDESKEYDWQHDLVFLGLCLTKAKKVSRKEYDTDVNLYI